MAPKSEIAWPVITLAIALAMMFFAGSHEYAAGIDAAILLGWWFWFYLYMRGKVK
jgi:hypothetical protein